MLVAGSIDHFRYSAGVAAPTFPQVLEVLQQPFATLVNNHAVAMPATVLAGELLLLFFTWRSNSDVICDVPAAWTALYNSNVSLVVGGACFAKDAAGTEGGTTVSCVTRNNVGGVLSSRVGTAIVYRITGWFGTLATGVEGTTANVGGTSTPSPPSLAPAWGLADNLFISHVHAAEDDATVNAAPANYTNLISQISGNGINNSCSSGSARRNLTAASDDPGNFTLSEGETCHTATVAVRPA